MKRIILFLLFVLLLASSCNKKENIQSIYNSGLDLSSCEKITEKDIHELCLRIKDKNPEEFDAIMLTNKFHGHIGPNNIYGTKMGLYAKKLLNGTNHEISVISEAGTKTPISCLNDGIMSSMGATFGRGLIQNLPDSGKLAATFFYKNKSVRLEVKPEKLKITKEYIKKSLKKHGGLTDQYFKDVRKMGLYVWENFDQDDLFIVTYPNKGGYYCDFNEYNLNAYFNRIHNVMHTGSPDKAALNFKNMEDAEKNIGSVPQFQANYSVVKEIIQYIKEDDCVFNGSAEQEEYRLKITATWKSNNKTVEFFH